MKLVQSQGVVWIQSATVFFHLNIYSRTTKVSSRWVSTGACILAEHRLYIYSSPPGTLHLIFLFFSFFGSAFPPTLVNHGTQAQSNLKWLVKPFLSPVIFLRGASTGTHGCKLISLTRALIWYTSGHNQECCSVWNLPHRVWVQCMIVCAEQDWVCRRAKGNGSSRKCCSCIYCFVLDSVSQWASHRWANVAAE